MLCFYIKAFSSLDMSNLETSIVGSAAYCATLEHSVRRYQTCLWGVFLFQPRLFSIWSLVVALVTDWESKSENNHKNPVQPPSPAVCQSTALTFLWIYFPIISLVTAYAHQTRSPLRLCIRVWRCLDSRDVAEITGKTWYSLKLCPKTHNTQLSQRCACLSLSVSWFM